MLIFTLMSFDHPITRTQRSSIPGAKFSILIPTWNNLEYLKLCIGSILKNSVFKHQLIVHINEGNDGTLEWIEQQNDIDYSYSEKNVGVCYALNSCRELVKTDYILYMNDDMYVCPDWDRYLWEEIEKTKDKNWFFSATSIEPESQSNCMIEHDFGRDLATFNERELLTEFATLPSHDWQGATWP